MIIRFSICKESTLDSHRNNLISVSSVVLPVFTFLDYYVEAQKVEKTSGYIQKQVIN